MIDHNSHEADKITVRLISEGNRVAFTNLFNSYWQQLFVYARNIVKDDQVAEDVIQEVFIDLWEHLGQRQVENVKGYLYNAVRYTALRQIRSGHFKDIHLNMFTELEAESGRNTTEESLDYNETNFFIEGFIQQLPNRCKEIFRLSRYEGLTNHEIAEKLHLSKRTVELQISNALKHLKISREKMLFWLLVASLLG